MEQGKPYDKAKSCKDCPDRTVEPNCHMTCEYHLKREERQVIIRKARKKNHDTFVMKFSNCGCKAGRGKW